MRRSKSNLGKPLAMEQLLEKLQDQETVGPVVTKSAVKPLPLGMVSVK